MKNALTVFCALTIAGSLISAAPAFAGVTKMVYIFHVGSPKFNKLIGLDCASGAISADETQVDQGDITTEADGNGGCTVDLAIESTAKSITLSFKGDDDARYIFTHQLKAAETSNPKQPIQVTGGWNRIQSP